MESKESWSQRAKCRDSEEDFFKDGNNKQAKRFCTGCTVIDLCKTYAIAHDEKGVWGGTSDRERYKLGHNFRAYVRLAFRDAGLLEHRNSLAWLEEREEELLREHKIPIVLERRVLESTSNQ